MILASSPLPKLALGLGVLGFILVFSQCQIVRAARTGTIIAWTGGKEKRQGFDCRVAERPVTFCFTFVSYLAVAVGTIWFAFGVLIGPFLWGETAVSPMIGNQDYEAIELIWGRPDRLGDPFEYVIYRAPASSVKIDNDKPIGTTRGTFYRDEGLESGTSYSYRIKARYEGVTAWAVGRESELSNEVLTTTLHR